MDDPHAQHQRHAVVLADIARYAGSSLELEEVLNRIALRAAALTGADRASIWLLDRSGRRLIPSALFGMDPAFTEEWKRHPLDLAAEPLSREVVETGRPVVVTDAAADPRTDKRSVAFFGDRSILVAPLVSRGRILGTLFLNHVRQQYLFTDADVATTAAIANQAAIAIDNAQLFHDTRRLAEQLRRSFRHAGEALAAGVDVQQTLQLTIQLAVEAVEADGGEIRLLDEAGRGTYRVASAGGAAREPGGGGGGREEVPLVADGRPLGALALWRAGRPFDADERELLASFAGHARAALAHARLYASLHEERERARQAERAQSEFESMISHELRTPLALIKAYAATLLHPTLALPPETGRRFMEGIAAATDRLGRLIDDLLSAARLESGVFELRPRPVEVGGLLRQALGATRLLAQGRRIDLDTPAGELWVLGDPDQLTQVVDNLVGNALKYAPDGSPVRVRAGRRAGRVRIAVEDAGPGIPEAALELVFTKYYRVQRGATRPDGGQPVEPAEPPDGRGERRRPHGTSGMGLGLGLYICRRIIEAHGGRIWAENLPQGGSAFHIELPGGAGTEAPGVAEPEGGAHGT